MKHLLTELFVLIAGAILVIWSVSSCGSPLVGQLCSPSSTLCDGRCADLSSDNEHCGDCDSPCSSGNICVAGLCQSPEGGLDAGGGCKVGELECGNTCTDVEVDSTNCGDCGTSCNSGAPICERGECVNTCSLTMCGDFCVDTDNNPNFCGDCQTSCPSGICINGACDDSCGIGKLFCDPDCIDPQSDPDNCGDCGIECTGATPVCVGGMCEATCPMPPNTMCGTECINTVTNPDHCGSCDNSCPSRRCSNSKCTPQVGGHFVWLGHDYSNNTNSNMRGLLVNGAFLVSNSVRVMTYEGTTEASSVTVIKSALQNVSGVSATFTDNVAPTQVSVQLNNHDVFLVYAQNDTATNASLANLGTSWATALDAFLRNGGVILVADGPATHDGTFQILEAAGLLSGSMVAPIAPPTQLQLIVPTDSIASGPAGQLQPLYEAITNTSSLGGFVGNADTTVVVEEAGATNPDPTVVHGFLRP